MGQAMVDCIFFSSSNGLACYRIAMESRFEPKDGGGEKTDDLSSTSVRSRHILVVQQITTVGGNLISADWAGWVCEEPLCLLACSCRVVSGERRDLSISAILRGENCVVRASRSVWRMSQRSWMLNLTALVLSVQQRRRPRRQLVSSLLHPGDRLRHLHRP
jgi:hypothetical protein